MALMYSGIWEAYLIDAPIAIRADNPMEVHPDERKWLTSNEHRRINSGERYSSIHGHGSTGVSPNATNFLSSFCFALLDYLVVVEMLVS
jgi:hypothetical protein